MPRPLKDQLKVFWCSMDANTFKELIADVFAEMFPNWTDETLTSRPYDAIHYCDAIRARAGRGLHDELILRTLGNLRKHR